MYFVMIEKKKKFITTVKIVNQNVVALVDTGAFVNILNTVFPLISAGSQVSAAPLGIHIEISAAPLNAALIRKVTMFC